MIPTYIGMMSILRSLDPGYSFDRVLFYGHFWNLLLLDLLVFAVVDLVARNYVLATVITCIVSWVSYYIIYYAVCLSKPATLGT